MTAGDSFLGWIKIGFLPSCAPINLHFLHYLRSAANFSKEKIENLPLCANILHQFFLLKKNLQYIRLRICRKCKADRHQI
jgi:hypothetical protein